MQLVLRVVVAKCDFVTNPWALWHDVGVPVLRAMIGVFMMQCVGGVVTCRGGCVVI